jgi:hypothetical protein
LANRYLLVLTDRWATTYTIHLQETLTAAKDRHALEGFIIRVARTQSEKDAKTYLLGVAQPKRM